MYYARTIILRYLYQNLILNNFRNLCSRNNVLNSKVLSSSEGTCIWCGFEKMLKPSGPRLKISINRSIWLLSLRFKKAGRFEKLLGFTGSHFIVTRGSVSLSCSTHHTLPGFLNLNGNYLKSKVATRNISLEKSSIPNFFRKRPRLSRSCTE